MAANRTETGEPDRFEPEPSEPTTQTEPAEPEPAEPEPAEIGLDFIPWSSPAGFWEIRTRRIDLRCSRGPKWASRGHFEPCGGGGRTEPAEPEPADFKPEPDRTEPRPPCYKGLRSDVAGLVTPS